MHAPSRRHVLRSALIGTAALAVAPVLKGAWASEPVVVVGAGPAGVAAALALRSGAPTRRVVLLERDPSRLARETGAAQPFARPGVLADQAALRDAGVELMLDDVVAVDWSAGRVELFSGRREAFGSLILAPGIAPVGENIAGLDARARHLWPAAWGSDRDARRLAGQLAALPENGHVVLRLPAGSGGLPQIAAQRAFDLAEAVARHGSARLTVLDAEESSAAAAAFAHLTADKPTPAQRVIWRGPREGGTVVAIDADAGRLETTAGTIKADVVNFIAPQGAGIIAGVIGLTDASGWCPCGDQGQSLIRQDAYVIGDAQKGAARGLAQAAAAGRRSVVTL